MVTVTGPRPTPVRTNDALTGPSSRAAGLRGNTSAESEHADKTASNPIAAARDNTLFDMAPPSAVTS